MDSAPAVKGSVLDPREFAARVEEAAVRAGFRTERYGEIAGIPLLALTRRTPGPRPRIYLSAGIHGDEPAPPLALLRLLELGVLDTSAVWFVCPLLNPAGFLRGTRESSAGIDLNRDYKALRTIEIQAHTRWLGRQPSFELAVCLHEDWESKGFYLYELGPRAPAGLARALIAAAAPCCPPDPSPVIDGRPVAEPGIIRPVSDPLLRDQWPEAIYLQAHHSRVGITLESPSSLPLEHRIGAHVAAVRCAVALTQADWDTRRAAGRETSPA